MLQSPSNYSLMIGSCYTNTQIPSTLTLSCCGAREEGREAPANDWQRVPALFSLVHRLTSSAHLWKIPLGVSCLFLRAGGRGKVWIGALFGQFRVSAGPGLLLSGELFLRLHYYVSCFADRGVDITPHQAFSDCNRKPRSPLRCKSPTVKSCRATSRSVDSYSTT